MRASKINAVIVSQYRASLAMLRAPIERCPEDLWASETHENRFWQIAYHALFYTHLYLSPGEESFEPWELYRPEYESLGPLPYPPYALPEIGDPYTQAEILDYQALVEGMVVKRVGAAPLEGPSGFPWLAFDRLELHLYNVRHIQHHAGQLVDRVRHARGGSFGWVGSGNMD